MTKYPDDFTKAFIERTKANLDFVQKALDVLSCEGWEIPQPTTNDKPGSDNLQEFVRHMRNGIAHGRLKFHSNGNKEVSGATVKDRPERDKPYNWEVKFTIEQLEDFTKRMTDYFLGLP